MIGQSNHAGNPRLTNVGCLPTIYGLRVVQFRIAGFAGAVTEIRENEINLKHERVLRSLSGKLSNVLGSSQMGSPSLRNSSLGLRPIVRTDSLKVSIIDLNTGQSQGLSPHIYNLGSIVNDEKNL